MKASDYPALWRASNDASESFQWWNFFWIRVHLGLLGTTGLVSSWAPSDKQQPFLAGAVALLMFAALVVGLVVRLGKFDERWFAARAFAENSKDAAWRFMMKPIPSTEAETEADEQHFLAELQQIRQRFPSVDHGLSKFDAGGIELTESMRDVRKLSMTERLSVYLEARLVDQEEWYRAKGKENAKSQSGWFFFIIVFEALAVVLAVARILATQLPFSPAGGIAAVAACFLAWTQAKRFSDLASTYGVACRDLGGLKAKASHVHTDEQLAAFVEDVEQAISREHRLWTERRAQ